jgi:adenosine deaminase
VELPRPTLDQLRRAPKVLLHDHLDGGLRPATVIELAHEVGHRLPAEDPEELAAWFHQGAYRHDLTLYLETFAHTVGVLQTHDALVRVARECAEDLADDGVVYAEVRFAPELHTESGLSLDDVVEAVVEGFAAGSAGTPLTIGALLTAMRTAARSRDIAELAVRHRDDGVVGFDIAGAEAGHPPTMHLDAFQYIQRANFHVTIHAGEAFGLPSIWEAIQFCGAERLGHGVRLVDDIAVDEDGTYTLGRLAAFVRDRRVALEMCPSSNVHTGAAPSLAEHPIGLLRRLRFRVTVNTDNRLMSDTSMTKELGALVDTFDFGWDDVEWLTINGMKSAFAAFDRRLRLIDTQIKPSFAALRAEAGLEPVPHDRLIAPFTG